MTKRERQAAEYAQELRAEQQGADLVAGNQKPGGCWWCSIIILAVLLVGLEYFLAGR